MLGGGGRLFNPHHSRQHLSACSVPAPAPPGRAAQQPRPRTPAAAPRTSCCPAAARPAPATEPLSRRRAAQPAAALPAGCCSGPCRAHAGRQGGWGGGSRAAACGACGTTDVRVWGMPGPRAAHSVSSAGKALAASQEAGTLPVSCPPASRLRAKGAVGAASQGRAWAHCLAEQARPLGRSHPPPHLPDPGSSSQAGQLAEGAGGAP